MDGARFEILSFFWVFFWMKKVGRNGGRSIRDMGGDLAPLLSGLKLDAGIQVQGRLQRVNTFFFFLESWKSKA